MEAFMESWGKIREKVTGVLDRWTLAPVFIAGDPVKEKLFRPGLQPAISMGQAPFFFYKT